MINLRKEKGVKFGRPRILLPFNTNEIINRYLNHEINNKDAARLIGVSKGTFYRLIKIYSK